MAQLGVIDDGAVLIVNGRIEDVGPGRRVENLAAARDATELSADGRVVMPGFVDCRTHLVCGPPLLGDYERRISREEPAGGEEAGRDLVRAIRASTRPRLEMLARKAVREFVRHGTTTLDAHTGLGLDEKTELKILRAYHAIESRPLDLMATFYGAAARPPENPGAYIERLLNYTLPKVKRQKLANFVDIRCGEGGFTPDEIREYLLAARGLGFIGRVTTDETAADGGVAIAVETGAASVDHLECITANDIGLLAGSSTVATLMPGASFHRLREHYPPARNLIDAGAAVALATGYSSDRCPTCSLPAVLSLACNQMKLTPAEAITAATINGASALRCDDQIGSIERGKQADLIMLNVSDYREIPYRFGMNLLAMSMKRGDVIYPRMEFPGFEGR